MALTTVNTNGIENGTIKDEDVKSNAAIALSKLADTGALGSAITATTQSTSDDTTKLATTAFVQAAVTSLIDGAPGSLNTLNELAAAINDDSSYATTLTTALATKAVLTGDTNNTIVTVTGANAITGEASLTYNGTDTLSLDHSTPGENSYIKIAADDNRRKTLVFDSGGTTRGVIGIGDSDEASATSLFLSANDNLAGNNPHLVIDNDGNILIHNRTSASSATPVMLDIGGQYTADASISQANLKLKLYSSSANNDAMGITAGSSGLSYVGAVNTDHIFYTTPSASGVGTLHERLRIHRDGFIGIGTDDPTDLLDLFSSTNNSRLLRLSHPTSPTGAAGFLGFNTDGTTDNNIITLGCMYSSTYYNVLNIKRSTRNVGINESNPQKALHIGSGGTLRFERGDGTRYGELFNDDNFVELGASTDPIRINGQSYIRFDIADEESARITDDGIKLPNNGKIELGGAQSGSGDLQIYHDESSSIIYDNGTGPLNIQTNNSNINIKGGSSAADDMAIFKSTEGVELFYGGGTDPKFETQSTGVKFDGELRGDDDDRIKLGTDQDLQIYHHSSHDSYIVNNDGFLALRSTENILLQTTAAVDMLKATPGGAVELYWGGTGAGKKLETNSGGVLSPGYYVTAYDGDKLITDASQGGGSDTIYIGNAAIQVSSDQRIKKDIINTTLDATTKLKQVRVVDYTWNDPSDKAPVNRNSRGTWTGCLAQEMVNIFPYVVNAPRKDDNSVDTESEKKWTLEYQHLVPALIKGFQEQQAEIETLKTKVETLETEVAALKAK